MEGNEKLNFPEPDKIDYEILLDKNQWLIRIRWIYSFFILLFFIVYTLFLNKIYVEFQTFLLILILSVLGNLIFIIYLMKWKGRERKEIKSLSFLASLQLDFDFVILFLFVFFSKGFESPVIVLFIFYIMVATFVIDYKKSLKNTIATVVLITVIFFKDVGLIVPSQKLVTLIAFDIILIVSFFISAFLSKNMRKNEKILQQLLKKTRELSITDGLTNLYNQTHFFEMLKHEIEQSRRYKQVFSLIIFDVDDFKKYNDNNGHIYGSRALEQIGSIMKKIFRSSDILARYGGDEYVIILPNTDKVGAFLAADRLRERVENEEFYGEKRQPKGKITISLGITGFPEHGNTVEEILSNADKALYRVKKMGGNRTIIYSEEIEKDE